MKRIISFGLLVLSFLLSSCGVKNITETTSFEVNNTYTFTDYEGEKTIEIKPKRIAMLYPSFSDIWLATGGTISIGVEDCVSRGYADSSMTVVGEGTGKTINMEALVASNPDFVILSHDFPNHDSYAESLKSYKIPYAIFEFNDYNDYLHILEVFSGINESNAYEAYGVAQEQKIQAIIDESKKKGPVKVLILRAITTKVAALNKSNFVGAMVNDLGCVNIADTDSSISAELSMEAIIRENPDVILLIPMGDEMASFTKAESILSGELWSNISAVKNKRIYRMEKSLFHYKPNTKWGEAYDILAKRIFNEE